LKIEFIFTNLHNTTFFSKCKGLFENFKGFACEIFVNFQRKGEKNPHIEKNEQILAEKA